MHLKIAAKIYNQSPVASYNWHMDALKSHVVVISLFNDALADYLQWPAADSAVKQDIHTITNAHPAALQSLKTNWKTTIITDEEKVNDESWNLVNGKEMT